VDDDDGSFFFIGTLWDWEEDEEEDNADELL